MAVDAMPEGSRTSSSSEKEAGFEQVCSRASCSWIEDCLSDLREPQFSTLLSVMLAVDVSWRRHLGESPALDEYETRFPHHCPLVREVFRQAEDRNRSTHCDSETDHSSCVNAADNLLHGLLAVERCFISFEQFIESVKEWTLRRSTLLKDILVERGAITETQRSALERLLVKHVTGVTANGAPASSSGVGGTLPWADDSPSPTMTGSPSHDDQIDGEPGNAFSVGVATSAGTRFRVLRPHAEGGLGRVFIARDEEIHRDVALKEIKPEYAERTAHRSRFLLEAEVTGGLEHPGVVPVYGLGVFPDGRPYYAMRFISGDNLRDAIERFHSLRELRRDRVRRNLELRALLRRFRDVCDTLAYAHSRGVVHRDIKPENIMLGKYGETLVVDWGLAKLTGSSPPLADDSHETPLESSVDREADSTRMGVAVGTPRYMSPEQALGQLDAIGPASDVYGLGATLYNLLTGRRAFEQQTLKEVLENVIQGKFLKPRELDRRVPRGLEAICLKAMSTSPADRYESVKGLSADVDRWLADEPVSCLRDSLAVRVARFARHHRGWTQGIAIGLLAVTVASTVAVVFISRARDQEAEARKKARQEAVTSGKVSDFLVNLFHSPNPLGLFSSDDMGFKQVETESANLSARELLDRGAVRIRSELKEQPEIAARLMETVAAVYADLGLYDEAARLFEDALKIQRRTLTANDPRLAIALRRLGYSKHFGGQFQEARKLYQEALTMQAGQPQNADTRIASTTTMLQLGLLLVEFEQFDEADALIERALSIRREILGDKHQAVAIALSYQAAAACRKMDDDGANRAATEALLIYAPYLGEKYPGRVLGRFQRGIAALERGEYKTAEEELRQSLGMARAVLGASHPYVAWAMSQHAEALFYLKRYDEAEREFKECERMSARFVKPAHPHYRMLRHNMAYLYFYTKRYEPAEQLLKQNLTLVQQSKRPDSLELARAESHLGEFLRARGRLKEAEKLLSSATGRVTTDRDVSPRLRWDITSEYGQCLLESGNYPGARKTFERALKAAELCKPRKEVRIAEARLGLGGALLLLGEAAPAESQLSESWKVFSERKPSPNRMRVASLLARCCFLQGRMQQAEELFLGAYRDAENIRAFNAAGFRDKGCIAWAPQLREWMIEFYEATGRPAEAQRYRDASNPKAQAAAEQVGGDPTEGTQDD